MPPRPDTGVFRTHDFEIHFEVHDLTEKHAKYERAKCLTTKLSKYPLHSDEIAKFQDCLERYSDGWDVKLTYISPTGYVFEMVKPQYGIFKRIHSYYDFHERDYQSWLEETHPEPLVFLRNLIKVENYINAINLRIADSRNLKQMQYFQTLHKWHPDRPYVYEKAHTMPWDDRTRYWMGFDYGDPKQFDHMKLRHVT